MTRWACLSLLGLAACNSSDPGVEPTLLADMPGLQITFAANSAATWVEIGFDERALGGCAHLDDSFRATVGQTEMTVQHEGGLVDLDPLDCHFPERRLDLPPAAGPLVLADDSKQVTIDLGARLARLLPEPAWIEDVGATARVRYEPAGALPAAHVKLVLASADGGPLEQDIPYGASSSEVTFTVPDRPGRWKLELRPTDAGSLVSFPCEGASCKVLRMTVPALAAPIEIRAAGP